MDCIKIPLSKDMSREDWLSLRRRGIGGSDAAAILGLNPWSSECDVYADKLGLLPPKEETEAMRQGRDLEDYVASRFTEKTGKKARRVNAMFQSCQNPFMLANVDRMIVGEDAGLECKTTSVLNLKKFKGGEFPETYYCQCVHYMAVTGAKRWYLAVLVLNQGFYHYVIDRDESEIAALVSAEADFWRNVESQELPLVDGSDATENALHYIFPPDDEKDPALLYGCEALIEQWFRLKSDGDRIEKAKKEIKNGLIAEMAGAPRGIATGYEVTYKTISKDAYTVKPKTYQQMNIREVPIQ